MSDFPVSPVVTYISCSRCEPGMRTVISLLCVQCSEEDQRKTVTGNCGCC